jgi:hypothetical protein
MPKQAGYRPRVRDICGSMEGYNSHARRGEIRCSDCLEFHRRYQRYLRGQKGVGRAFIIPTELARFRHSMDGLGLAIARAVRESA